MWVWPWCNITLHGTKIWISRPQAGVPGKEFTYTARKLRSLNIYSGNMYGKPDPVACNNHLNRSRNDWDTVNMAKCVTDGRCHTSLKALAPAITWKTFWLGPKVRIFQMKDHRVCTMVTNSGVYCTWACITQAFTQVRRTRIVRRVVRAMRSRAETFFRKRWEIVSLILSITPKSNESDQNPREK